MKRSHCVFSPSSTKSMSGWIISNRQNHRPVPAIATEYLAKILTSQVYEAAIETPLTYAPTLSSILNNELYFKREDMQPVFSFKIRGAYNKIAKLTPNLRSKGVVTCSAGNHAQGVAMSASKLNINAIIVMPIATPAIKVNAVRRFGGPTVTVKLHGQNYDEAAAEAKRLEREMGLTLIHPFDDPDVIAGQGTVGMEILKLMNGKRLDAIFACVGGGGLLSGIAAYVKAIRPDIKVIGVEADDAAGMTASLRAGKVVTLPSVGLFADGAAVKTVGNETFNVCHQLVDEMITVQTDEICAAIKIGFNETRCVLEPAGALAIAGMVKYIKENKMEGCTYVAISSGANMDFDRLRFVSERADSGETLIAVAVPERQGAFKELHSLLYPRNITEFSYRHNGSEIANIVVSFQALSGRTIDDDKMIIKNTFNKNGFIVTDLSQNEMAKSHARHLAGGRRKLLLNQDILVEESSSKESSSSFINDTFLKESNENDDNLEKIFLDTLPTNSSSLTSSSPSPSSSPSSPTSVSNFISHSPAISQSLDNQNNQTEPELLIPEFKEFLYRFEFPESPGALNNFFCSINQFNEGSRSISLLHYRNHGHDYGSVLVGFLVRPDEKINLSLYLKNIGYDYYDETLNSAYTQFLQ